MSPPGPDAERRPATTPTDALHSNPDASRRSTVPRACHGELEVRCADGVACVEVTARTREGEVAIHVHGDVTEGERLLASARRIAELHGYGSPARRDLEESA